MKTSPVLFAALAISLLSACGSTSSGPAAPTSVLVKQALDPNSVAVSFDWAATGDPATFTVTATPGLSGSAPIVVTGTSSPILVTGLTPRAGYTFNVAVATGAGSASTTTGLLRFYTVVETFREPMTQPNDTIFTGSFTFDATNKVVSGLVGSLTQAMTKHD
ncbi:MAG TPA: fibronectin type III domain-containing protein, partial [Anaeromyxobacteraceae bacterium]|nr:fibronectin type III domain-containing protein [Anaeromyxobacteraceae bacterium]